ncbi:MAG TPA: MFS transporter, partial [Humisphaera sp.]
APPAVPSAPAAPPELTARLLWVMATACGVVVANLYYNQPLLEDLARHFGSTRAQAGLVSTAAQVGYGVGLFFFVPLGDLLERRRLVLGLLWACTAVLAGMAAAPSLLLLIVCQLLVGATGVGAQVLIPLAIDLSPPARRGRTIGVMMAGLLCGILLARTVSGALADRAGWRAVYVAAVAATALLGVVLHATLPHHPPTLRTGYGSLLRSMLGLLRDHPPLWTASAVSGLSFAGFTAFWTSLSFLMAERFGLGATEAGRFGVVGVAGALAAPLAGRVSDRYGPAVAVTAALAASAVAFGVMWAWVTIPALVVGVLLMDLGVQSIQVAEQSLVMALDPAARSRLNTVYMVARFMGGAGGSAAGALAWTHWRWPGVCGLSLAFVGAGVLVHALGPKVRRAAVTSP